MQNAPDEIPLDQFVPDQAAPRVAKQQGIPDEIPLDQFKSDEDKYGGVGQQAISALEGAASSATFGASTGVEKALGVKPEDIRGRRETNPLSHGAGQIAGLIIPSLVGDELPLAGKLMGAAGEAGAGALGLGAKGAGALSNIGAAATKGAIETAIFQGGDEVSKMISEDPNQTAQTALTDIGLSAVLGGVTGGVFGAVPELWKATAGNKTGQFIEDFKGRMNHHMENPDPVGAVTEELQNRYTNVKDMADEVYGAKGLKAQEIQKLMPEMNEKIASQVQDVNDTLEKSLKKLSDDPNLRVLQGEATKWQSVITNPEATSGDVFNATQELKQQLQDYGQFNKNIPPPISDRAFVKAAKELSFDLRNKLEDPEVWGKAAERQQSINSAFKEYLPALKDFEKRFTTKLATGENVVDPGKINTYINQIGKPNAELKQTMLKSFLDASQKYEKVIEDTHANLGIENPMKKGSLALTHGTLNQLPAGAKLADAIVNKALARLGGETIGAGIGGVVGHTTGIPGAGWIGALVGEKALSPFFTSVLPALTKPLLQGETNAEGLKSAIDYGLAAVRGESLLNKTTKAVFKAGGSEALDNVAVSDKERNKLDKRLEALQKDSAQMLNNNGSIGHYLPLHGTAIASTTANAVNFLNAQRPSTQKTSILDKEPRISAVQKSQYERTLDIAQQPLIVMKGIKNGETNSRDINTLKTLYPSLYKSLSSKLYNQIIEHDHEKDPLPYKTVQGVSLFIGQPLDSTLKQESIQAAQMANAASSTKNQAQENQMPGPHKASSQGGLQKLAKYGQALQTSAQRNESGVTGSK